MAAGYIERDDTFPTNRNVVAALLKIREGREQLRVALASVEWGLRDGDGSLAAHYALYATEGGFVQNGYASANAAAKAMYDEALSLYSKLIKQGGQGDETGAAIDKLAGYLGI